jgi:galactoside O-acetyltransferase
LEIGEGSHVFSHFSLLRPSAKIRVGRRCQLGQSHFICADSIEVGDDVIMAWGVTIIDSDNHSLYWSERQYDVERCRKDYIETGGRDLARTHDWSKAKIAKVRIGDKSWIGFNVIILKGVTVGEGAIVGAGSVLTSDVKPWHLGAGNPLTHKRQLSRSRDEANVG